jgi:Zn-dependent peptidase ImmA (M78 family)
MHIAGNAPSVEAAVKIVTSWVLNDVACPPTDLEAISSRLDIVGFDSEELPGSGELRRDGKGFKVVYSSSLSPERQRFTIAHEMGHAIFEASGPNCPRSGVELERICDLLATEILMPTGIFLKLLGEKLSLRKVFELAKTFKTSLSATAIRCAELRRVSVFEMANESVLWSRGVVRRIEDPLKPTINKILSGQSVDEIIAESKIILT